ncbi:All-trans-nonaprenyl-diphosphate synthase (geranyl-diphosphate specific) [Aureliella helgolandensis]|uniref:All-trans-nonaprenyl-diphosphate synthase (Geranyl-diphosphate specific) n=1 Tax=Aureliella helgolandensis TaxID=2527968 RepID=A0A518G5M2_9BACT|nr:All-trans-nonaprenyl-diphosphate synthase (geranyl-diphosphate specific) [Aureliella helgolandensis]
MSSASIDSSASHEPSHEGSSAAAQEPNARPKSRRRKTSHLKLVPETLELREHLKNKCSEVAGRLDKSRLMTKDEMEVIARKLLDDEGLSEGYVGWIMVILSSEFYRDQVAATDPSRRLFLLPHCLKHAEGCPADYDEFGMNCKQCGACSIADFRTIAEDMGYKVLVAEGSPVVMKIIVSGYVDAIVGVACLNVLEKAIDKLLLAGIPCMAVPLLSSDCRNTSVDEAWVSEMIQTRVETPVTKTRSYVHLLRTANDLFGGETFERLTPRSRASQPTNDSDDLLAGIDPIAATETLALDFVRRGGKYSRPFMTLATYDALTGGQATLNQGASALENYSDSILRSAMSIEMFHKASLVHDDIEDDDGYRYGQETMHRKYGLATAINVGDYLIGLGYRMVSREAGVLGADCAADILDCLAGAHTRLSEGQGAELLWRDASDKRLTPLDALKVYALKTSPAFEAALYTGARLAGNVETIEEHIRVYARNIGVAFQILNDLGDWEGDSHNKLQAGGDVLGGRPTLLWALALANLPEPDQARLLSLASPNCSLSDSERISQVSALYRQARVFEQARRLIEKHEQRALEAAAKIDSEPFQRLLLYLVDTVLARSEPTVPTIVSLPASGLLPVVAPG